MKTALALVFLCTPSAAWGLPQEAPAAQQAQAADSSKTQAEREADFARLLTDCTLQGFTTLDGQEGVEGDSYTLKKVSKQDDGRWKFEAVIHYGGTPIPISVALPVEWAGDTPVISVTDMAVPFMGKYDARVLFHGDQYVGVWSGDGYGGHIFGKVVANPLQGSENGTPQGVAGDDQQAGIHWPGYRGQLASGVASGFPSAASWNLESGDNVKWRIPVKGMAHSSPVIWGDRLFLTTAVREAGDQELKVGLYGSIAPVADDSKFSFQLHCYDKNSGEQLWKRTLWSGVPAIARHPKGSHAASTPAVDSKRVLAFFGTEGLYAFDHEGTPLWQKDLGVLDSGYFADKTAQWGFASSPVLHKDRAIVQCDVQDQSFLAVLDAADGLELWRTNREEAPGWSTPTVYDGPKGSQIICNGWKHMGAYSWDTGEELWRVVPGGDIPVPTPVLGHGNVYLTNAHGRAAPILAVDLEAKGEISFAEDKREYLKWGTPRGGNYMQTPLIVGDEAYFCRDNGALKCFDAKTGDKHYDERLGTGRSGFTASGVSADGKLYFPSEEGQVYVIEAGPELKVLGTYSVGEECMATPAISEGTIFFRTRGHLLAVGS